MMFHNHPKPLHPLRLQTPDFAQLNDPMSPTWDASTVGLPPEFHGPILLPHLVMNLTKEQEQPVVLYDSCTRWPISPSIIANATHAKGITETAYSMVRLLSPDGRVLHVDSLAKYAAVGSTGERNTGLQYSRRRLKSQGLPWPLIQS